MGAPRPGQQCPGVPLSILLPFPTGPVTWGCRRHFQCPGRNLGAEIHSFPFIGSRKLFQKCAPHAFPVFSGQNWREEGHSEVRALAAQVKSAYCRRSAHSTGPAAFTAGSTCLSAGEMGAWAAPASGRGPCHSHHPGAHTTLRSFAVPHPVLGTCSTNTQISGSHQGPFLPALYQASLWE